MSKPNHPLAAEFDGALALINNNEDDRLKHAIKAQEEIRDLLEKDDQLKEWGVKTILIGSYARRTGIFPGKDVDVFTKLTALTTESMDPATIVKHVSELVINEYGDERAKQQNRSVMVSFDKDDFEFSVDVVPAVVSGDRWAIPRHDTGAWSDPGERWVETDPEKLTELKTDRNKDPKVGSQGAYVPVVKLVRQTRKHHRADEKPGGFYFELLTYWAFEGGDAVGDTFAELFATTLHSIASQLNSGAVLIDPVLGQEYRPVPTSEDLKSAAELFARLADKASQAVSEEDRCKAARLWREILGENSNGAVFPIPDGCDEEGRGLPVIATPSSRVTGEPSGFA